MSTLYLDRKNLEIRIASGTLTIYQNGSRQSSLPLKLIERIVARSDVQLNAGILATIASAGIGFTAISGRKGEKVAHLIGSVHNDAKRRIAHYRTYADIKKRAEFARATVTSKLHNQHRFIKHLLDVRPDSRYALTQSSATISRIQAQLVDEADLDRLRGFEGAAAAAYFNALKAVMPPRLNFTGRNRRPPKDPVNACLSLSYTLAHSDAVRSCHMAGLDPLIGMLHEPAYGRESLASDFIEPLRPHIDRWVWEMFRDRILDEEHFSREGEACLLIKSGRQIFFGNWEKRAPSLRRWLRKNAWQHVGWISPVHPPDKQNTR